MIERLAKALADRYRIERELGAGGMATVYLAHDVKHDRLVAIKVMRPEVAHTIGGERFLREIHLAAKLSHPHILPLHDSGELDGLLFYVMPNVDGSSLRERMTAVGKLPIDEAVRITQEVAGALDYAHRHGVVHRDIKPENIMLHEGQALVADFGIGKALGAVEGAVFTHSGTTVGTPAYMSPEQAAGDSIDGRSDIYSLGCVLYEMLTGEQPFTGATVQAVIAKRFVQTPADVTALREGVSRPLARVVQRALARTPIDRFETGAMFASALAEHEAPYAAKDKSAAPPDKSIAVLPFANLSADPENEFFADGITEEILNALSQIAELHVAGRTSAFSFKGKHQDLRAIGEQLNVRTVLEGSVRRSGKRVRITAQLVDVTDGYQLWSERYDREIEDVFAVQDEIASAIAGKMKTTLRGGEARSQRATDDIEAYEAYLKGRALINRRGAAIKQGLALMEKALALDPEYGLAWAGMADTYSLLGWYGQLTPEEARGKATEAAAKAIRFAPDLAEAHAARGLVASLEWDWAAAEQSFKRALELNPGYVQGAAWYHWYYQGCVCGRWDEALRGLHKVHERDQLSGYAAGMVSLGYAFASDDPFASAAPAAMAESRALEWAEKALVRDPDAFLSVWARQLAYQALADWPNAFASAISALAMPGRQVLALMALGLSLAASGDMTGARSVYDEMRSRAVREYIPPSCLAAMAAALGEHESAAAYAREAARRHDPFLIFARSFPDTDRLRQLPEYQQILTDIRLPVWVGRARREIEASA